jgi:hypothetical protein
MDLLTTLTHELGHVLGLGDDHSNTQSIMGSHLLPYERKVVVEFATSGLVVQRLRTFGGSLNDPAHTAVGQELVAEVQQRNDGAIQEAVDRAYATWDGSDTVLARLPRDNPDFSRSLEELFAEWENLDPLPNIVDAA